MDPNVVVLEISSDEEVGWDGHDDKEIDGGEHNWIAELLDEVNRDDSGYDDGAADSDEVVIVSEVLPSRKPRRKLTSKYSSLIGSDDDCVVLDHDPDKPLEVRNDDPIDRHEDDDSDDLLVVSETGQVACRDYPHPRHLCIKLPFSSTPNKSYCDQCYCYVCDSLAPCLYWGNGSASIHHCHATDKDEFWKLERKNSKSNNKVANVSLSKQWPIMTLDPSRFQTPSTAHNQVPQPIPDYFGGPNINNQNRSPVLSSRNKHQPGLIRTSNRVHHNYNLATPSHKPVFKRIGSAGVAPTTNRYNYNYRRQDNRVNEMVSGSSAAGPFSPAGIKTLEERRFSTNPTLLSSQSQGASYSIPCESSQQGNQDQRSSTIDQNFFHDINWPQSGPQNSQIEGAGPTNELSHATGPGGLVDYQYDDWIFNNQACEAGSMEIVLEEFCPEPAFIDAGTMFDF